MQTSFVYVSIGTDVRSSVEAAVVTDGLPYRGARGLAVDAGHMILDPQGPLCSCGQRGCWQAMVDVDREVELARARLAAGETSVLQRYAGERRTRRSTIGRSIRRPWSVMRSHWRSPAP